MTDVRDRHLYMWGEVIIRQCAARTKPDGSIELQGFAPTGELPTLTMLAIDGAVRPLTESHAKDHGMRRIVKYRVGRFKQKSKLCTRTEVHITFAKAA